MRAGRSDMQLSTPAVTGRVYGEFGSNPERRTQGRPGIEDHSLEVVALLTQLLNDSRIAGDIPTTQRLEVVP